MLELYRPTRALMRHGDDILKYEEVAIILIDILKRLPT